MGELVQMLGARRRRTLIARGAGRSYGDACLNEDGDTVMTERLNRMLAFDPEAGTVRCEAGVLIADLLEVFVPRGWFPPVTPGTKFVTLGGAVAADVHGKNHHRDGSFGRFVRELTLLLPSGEVVTCSATSHPDLFGATVGGMGLTGIILEVELALQPVETPHIAYRGFKARDLAEAFELFDEHEPAHRYSVAWLDCLARGRHLGRSVLMFGNHATREEAGERRGRRTGRAVRVPVDVPAGLLNPLSMRAFNAAYYALKPARARSLVHYDPFFYPLDSVLDWNRVYGRRGLVQYQCVLPPDTSRDGLTRLLELCSSRGRGSFLVVLKRFGAQDGWLSFPRPGYTLALDMPVTPGVLEFLDELDTVVLRHGGRVYLAKDARLAPATFRAMYPDWPRWAEVRARVDPHGVLASAMSRRLELHG